MEKYKVKDVLAAILSWKDWLASGDERLWQGYGEPFLDDWQMSGGLEEEKNRRRIFSMQNQEERFKANISSQDAEKNQQQQQSTFRLHIYGNFPMSEN